MYAYTLALRTFPGLAGTCHVRTYADVRTHMHGKGQLMVPQIPLSGRVRTDVREKKGAE